MDDYRSWMKVYWTNPGLDERRVGQNVVERKPFRLWTKMNWTESKSISINSYILWLLMAERLNISILTIA